MEIKNPLLKSTDIRMTTDLSIFYSDLGLNIFYNTHEKNAQNPKNKKQKLSKFPIKNNVILKANVDLKGKLKFNKVNSASGMHIGGGCIKTIDDQYYVLGFDQKYKNIKLGVLKP